MQEKVKPLHARLDRETREKLEALAQHHQRSITNMIVVLIHEAYKEIKKD